MQSPCRLVNLELKQTAPEVRAGHGLSHSRDRLQSSGCGSGMGFFPGVERRRAPERADASSAFSEGSSTNRADVLGCEGLGVSSLNGSFCLPESDVAKVRWRRKA